MKEKSCQLKLLCPEKISFKNKDKILGQTQNLREFVAGRPHKPLINQPKDVKTPQVLFLLLCFTFPFVFVLRKQMWISEIT